LRGVGVTSADLFRPGIGARVVGPHIVEPMRPIGAAKQVELVVVPHHGMHG
jgi:hypothetical protein